jgi:hypothetical protein
VNAQRKLSASSDAVHKLVSILTKRETAADGEASPPDIKDLFPNAPPRQEAAALGLYALLLETFLSKFDRAEQAYERSVLLWDQDPVVIINYALFLHTKKSIE